MAHQKNGFRLLPVAPETYAHLLPKGGEGVTIAEVQATDQLYDLVSRYVAQNGNKTSDHSHSWDISSHSATRSMPWGDDAEEDDDNADWEESETKEKSRLGLGLGIHEVTFQGRSLRVVHQAIGKPVGSSCGVQVFTSLVLFAEGRNEQNLLTAFCDHVFEWDSVKDDDQYNIYMWKPDQWYWHKVATKRVRPVESVILPADIKTKVVKDLAGFNKRETARWYAHHGIPYKRCLLFHGPPGTGKSSFITALAGQLKRNVCFLQAAHPDITDDNLQACVQRAPSRSLIVMEDVDALFTRNRESMASNSPLTFSGLLNSLDGVCNPEGQVFILTTNHIERLDPALIRPGRVDLKVRFTTATKEQVEALFLHFYPGEADLAREFADVIASRAPEIISAFQAAEEKRKEEEAKAKTEEGKGEEEEKDASKSKPQEVKLLAPVEPDGGLGISMASLQQLFIVCRTSSAAEALTEARTFAF